MTRKTIIIASVSLTLAVTAFFMIRSYFNSVGYYASMEFHYQQQKQSASQDLAEAEKKILEYRGKKDSIRNGALKYLDDERDLQIETESKGE